MKTGKQKMKKILSIALILALAGNLSGVPCNAVYAAGEETVDSGRYEQSGSHVTEGDGVQTATGSALAICTCAEKCTEETLNVWCDACGTQGISACNGEDTATVYATSGSFDGITWSLDNAGTLTIRGSGSINSQDEYNGPWESYTSEIITVIIEEGVTEIGAGVFRNCDKLESISIPNSVTSIGIGAFMGCSSLYSIDLPGSVTSIGARAFSDCTDLTSVILQEGTETIGAEAFSNCTSLTSISFPDGLKSIGEEAFNVCVGLQSIEIPNSVETIGADAFLTCYNLQNITIPCNLSVDVIEGCAIDYSHVSTVTYVADESADTITKKCDSCSGETITLIVPTKVFYTGEAIEASYEGNIRNEVLTITYSGNELVDGKPVNVGTYSATLTIMDSENNEEKCEVSKSFTINYLSAPNIIYYNGDEMKDGYGNEGVTVSASGYTISDTLGGTYLDTYTITAPAVGGVYKKTLYFKNVKGEMTAGTELSVTFDFTGPSFSSNREGIIIKDNWCWVLRHTITFDCVYTDASVEVTVQGHDEGGSGIDCYYYWVDKSGSETVLTVEELDGKTFASSYNGILPAMSAEGRYVYYAYATDKVGNRSKYICSNGVVIDRTAPALNASDISVDNIMDTSATITASDVTDGGSGVKAYYLYYTTEENSIPDADMVISLAEQGDTHAKYNKNGTFDINGLNPNTGYFFVIVVTDKAGNRTAFGTSGEGQFVTKKIIPTFDEMPTVSGTYGQPLSLMTVSQITGTNSVAGTWSITEENANAIYPTIGSGVAYELTFTPTDTDTYETITKSVVPTVTPKTVTVTAGNAEKTYGEEDPVFTYTVADNGLVGNDTLTGTLSRETGENVGTYTVQQGTLTNESNPNYDIRFEGGTFTIRALDLSGGTATQDNTLKYDGTAQKPTFTVTLQGNSLTEADYDITVTEQRNVGSYTATITGKGNYSGTITNVAWIIGKSDPTADMFRVVLPANLDYDGSEKVVTVEVNDTVSGMGEITVKYSAAPVNAGSYTVFIDVTEGTNYTSVSNLEAGTFTINKATPEYTAPTVNAGLVYSGEALALVTAGAAEHGTIQYSLDGSNWGTEVPVGTNVKEYFIYYKVAGEENYCDIEPVKLVATISKATPYIAEKPLASGITYGEILSGSVLTGGTVHHDADTVTVVSGTFSWKSASEKPTVADSNATEYEVTFTPEDAENYESVVATVKLTVAKAAAPALDGATKSYAYSRELTGESISITGLLADCGEVTYTIKEISDSSAMLEHVAVDVTGKLTFDVKKLDTYAEGLTAKITVAVSTENYADTVYTVTITRGICEHTETEIKNVASATCGQAGYTGDVYCKDCNERISLGQGIPATGHNYREEITAEPTTTSEGVRTYTCENCGNSYTESIPKLPAPTEAPTSTPTPVPTEAPESTPTPVPTEVPEKLPQIQGEDGKSGWDIICDEIGAAIKEGENTSETVVVIVEMNGATKVPRELFEQIANKDIFVDFVLDNGFVWTVNGKTVTAEEQKEIDFAVALESKEKPLENIPVEVINKITSEHLSLEMQLAHSGEFGFDMVLTIELEKKNAGLYANLFFYHPDTKELEFICADVITEDGKAKFVFTHASDYLIVLNDVSMLPAEEEQVTEIIYTVVKGDTLARIAKKYECTVQEIVAMNSNLIKNPNLIRIGWKLRIPVKGAGNNVSEPERPEVPVVPVEDKNYMIYIVKKGDALWRIAEKYGCTMEDLIRWNSDLIENPGLIYAGWELKIYE